jgi:DNA polymerase/3'-5' exonuclease PolX
MMNEQIINIFHQLHDLRISQNEPWRAKAYQRAIDTIKNYPQPLTSGAEAQKLPGIGASLASKIDEIIQTGTVAELSMAQSPKTVDDTERDNVLKLFQTIERVGPVTAKRWYDAGYRRIEDIPQEATTEGQWIGIQLYYDLIQRIPREEIQLAEKLLHQCLDPLGIEFEIAGSYRRGKANSGDIDILVIDNPDMDVLNTVVQCPLFRYRLAQGEKKFLGVGLIDQLHRRIDVELVQPQHYPFAIVYFTGPGSFNVKMREYAAHHGLRLNEKGLFGSEGEFYPAQSEKDLFHILGLKYLTPEERNKY